ncbi:hypothetical protein ACFLRM_02175 [Acidobacteriota bacterium]
MNWGMYGILAVLGIFIILFITNPRLSCFGRKVSSPLYPLLRKKKKRKIKTEDYGFDLDDGNLGHGPGEQRIKEIKTKLERYSRREEKYKRPFSTLSPKEKHREVKTEDYGFNLAEKTGKQMPEKGIKDTKQK